MTMREDGSRSQLSLLRRLDDDPEAGQAFEALLASIRLSVEQLSWPSVLVTSTHPSEGKTTITSLLAITMARAGMRVAIVDADLRRPRLHDHFGVARAPGFPELLSGTAGLADIAQFVPLEGANQGGHLDVVSAGIGSGNLLTGIQLEVVQAAVQSLAEKYDIVLLDSPPILAVSDGLLLAKAVDAVVMVVSAGAVSERDARVARERLTKAGARMIGFVMNRFDESEHGPGYHPRGSYYYADREKG